MMSLGEESIPLILCLSVILYWSCETQVSDYIERSLVSTTIVPGSALNPAVDILYVISPPNRTKLLFPFYVSPVLPFAIVGRHVPSVAVTSNMEHGHINVRLAIPINSDAIVVRSPRTRAKAKAKS